LSIFHALGKVFHGRDVDIDSLILEADDTPSSFNDFVFESYLNHCVDWDIYAVSELADSFSDSTLSGYRFARNLTDESSNLFDSLQLTIPARIVNLEMKSQENHKSGMQTFRAFQGRKFHVLRQEIRSQSIDSHVIERTNFCTSC
jgi:hypothetical protein